MVRKLILRCIIDFINQFNVDFGLLGISAIGEDGSLRDFDYRKVKVSQAIMANSKTRFLAADPSKFTRDAMVRSGSLADITALFIAGGMPEPLHSLCQRHKVKVYDADVPGDFAPQRS